jgi:hypothetical protein
VNIPVYTRVTEDAIIVVTKNDDSDGHIVHFARINSRIGRRDKASAIQYAEDVLKDTLHCEKLTDGSSVWPQ